MVCLLPRWVRGPGPPPASYDSLGRSRGHPLVRHRAECGDGPHAQILSRLVKPTLAQAATGPLKALVGQARHFGSLQTRAEYMPGSPSQQRGVHGYRRDACPVCVVAARVLVDEERLLRAPDLVGRRLANLSLSQLTHETHPKMVDAVVERTGGPSLKLGADLGATLPCVFARYGGTDQGLHFDPNPGEVLV